MLRRGVCRFHLQAAVHTSTGEGGRQADCMQLWLITLVSHCLADDEEVRLSRPPTRLRSCRGCSQESAMPGQTTGLADLVLDQRPEEQTSTARLQRLLQ